MNSRSLQHSITLNQPSSWTEDPFDIKGTGFKGVNLNPKRSLSDYAEQLISAYGSYDYDHCEISLSDIPSDEQNELLRLYIDSTGRELTECVNGDDFSIDNDYTCALMSMLKNDCCETRDTFARVTRKNILTYYTESLQELLDNECNNYRHNLANELDMCSETDLEHGDVVWVKF